MDQVRTMIDRNGWHLVTFSEDVGFYDQRPRPARTVGVKHIRADLGDYRDLPFQKNVTVFWAFDERRRLTDVWVWKTSNGL
jgi:hypothetical protein